MKQNALFIKYQIFTLTYGLAPSTSCENLTWKMTEESAKRSTALNNELTLDRWEAAWTNDEARWHQDNGNETMWKHFPKLVADNFPDRQPIVLKVFVPLCGKAKDMLLLHKMGFTVVGVEFASQPIKEFFEENLVDIKTDPAIASDQKYTVSSDGKLIIGQGDLFGFTPENLPFAKYDIIWDRGSFEAMNDADRPKYAKLLSSLLSEEGFYFINTPDYDLAEYGGPPLAAQKEVIEKYFSDMTVELLDRTSMLNDYFKSHGLTRMDALYHVMKWKAK